MSSRSPFHSDHHKLRTVEDVTERNVRTIATLEEAAKANRSQSDRLADKVPTFVAA